LISGVNRAFVWVIGIWNLGLIFYFYLLPLSFFIPIAHSLLPIAFSFINITFFTIPFFLMMGASGDH
jgi:hypothetical protein